VAIGLLTGINREIVQKLLKRFLRYAKPAPAPVANLIWLVVDRESGNPVVG